MPGLSQRSSEASVEESNLFRGIVFFVDSSVPPTVADPIKKLLTGTGAAIALTLDAINVPPSQSGSNSRFDLITTTHVISNCLNMPEYREFGQHRDDLGSVLALDSQNQDPSRKGNTLERNFEQSRSRYIHIVTPLWVTMSYDHDKLLPTASYSPDPTQFFTGIVVTVDPDDDLLERDRDVIEETVTAFGGQFKRELSPETTHLICSRESTSKAYQKVMAYKKQLDIKVVLPHWFNQCTVLKRAISEAPFEFPKPPILEPFNPSNLSEYQHATKNSETSSQAQVDAVEFPTATRLAFDARNVSRRPVSVGLSEYLHVITGDTDCDAEFLKLLPKKQSETEQRPHTSPVQAIPAFQNKTVYLVSTLPVSEPTRQTLVTRIKQLGARVYDARAPGPLEEDITGRNGQEKCCIPKTESEEALRRAHYVICEFREGWEYWLSWELKKSIGTIHWIMTILNNSSSDRCVVRSPDRLLDFPVPTGRVSGWPLDQDRVTVTTYTGVARNFLIRLIQKMGLTYTGSFDSTTNLLVAADKTSGSKVKHALNMGSQIVNHLYIEECFRTWSKVSFLPIFVNYPDGVNFLQLVGEQPLTLNDIAKWAGATENKKARRAALAQLPFKQLNPPMLPVPRGHSSSPLRDLSTPITDGAGVDLQADPDEPVNEPIPESVPLEEVDLNADHAEELVHDNKENSSLPSELPIPLWSGESRSQSTLRPLRNISGAQNPSRPASLTPPAPRSSTRSASPVLPLPSSKKRARRMLISPRSMQNLDNDEIPTTKAPPEPDLALPLELKPVTDVNDALATDQGYQSKSLSDPSPPHDPAISPPPGRSRSEKRLRVESKATRPSRARRSEEKRKTVRGTKYDPSGDSGPAPELLERAIRTKGPSVTQDINRTPARRVSRHQTTPACSNTSGTPSIRRTRTESIVDSPDSSKAKSVRTNRHRTSDQNAADTSTASIQTDKRTSSRHAAKVAQASVARAAMDMNLHAKEKKRKRLSGMGLAGTEDGGYFADVAAKPVTHSANKTRQDGSKAASSTPLDQPGPVASTSKRPGRGLRDVKVDDDDDHLPSDSEVFASVERKRLSKVGVKDQKFDDKSESDDQVISSKGKHRAVTMAARDISGSKKSKLAEASNANLKREKSGVRILQSGTKLDTKMMQALKKLGATFVNEEEDLNVSEDQIFTHFLAQKITRSQKFLLAIINGSYILTHDWVKQCIKAKQLVEPQDRHWLHDAEGEEAFGFKLQEAVARARASKLLAGEVFYVSPNAFPDLEVARNIIESAGGRMTTKVPLVKDIRGHPEAHVISCERDRSFWKNLMRKKDDEDAIPIYNKDAVSKGLLTQNMVYDKSFQILTNLT